MNINLTSLKIMKSKIVKKIYFNLEEYFNTISLNDLQKIGEGSFSEVYCAFEKKSYRSRAIKITVCNN